jgi:hypothetical protein
MDVCPADGYAVLSARLTDLVDPATAKLAGRTLVFEVGGRTLTATTDASGTAVARLVLPLRPAPTRSAFASSATPIIFRLRPRGR